MIKRIESKENERFKNLKKLKERKHRKSQGEFLIEGERFLDEALRQNAKIEEIILRDHKKENVEESKVFKKYSTLDNIDILILDSKLFNELSSTVTSQGIIARVKKPSELNEHELEIENGKFLVLDEIQDPGNLGTIIRSAHAFNLDGIFLMEGTTDPFSEKALRSSMGSIFKVPLKEYVTLEDIDKLINADFTLYISTLENAKDLRTITFKEKSLIVIGNEGNGVSQKLLSRKHIAFKIIMPGNAESLNAAVAASITMFELNK